MSPHGSGASSVTTLVPAGAALAAHSRGEGLQTLLRGGRPMNDAYSLTLYNRSSQPAFTFAVYVVVTVRSGQRDPSNVYPLVWLAKPLDDGGQVTFQWTLDFSLVYADLGCQENNPWCSSSEAEPVQYDDTARNSMLLDYPNSAYTFTRNPAVHPVKPPEVYIDTTGTVPAWTLPNGPSVGLAVCGGEEDKPLAPIPAIVTDSGPNLCHTFDLSPAYFIHAGQDDANTMIRLDTVKRHQQVNYDPGVYFAQWTLDKANEWICGPP
ncbi:MULTISPECIES: hypothetical protein [Streptomyces]|uniref:Secreted protein n=1 Tax=Streptomyces ramulosus TaxID=47762 RepID=A0ABW1FQT6_9ACTN